MRVMTRPSSAGDLSASDADLVRASLEGDRRATEVLFRRHAGAAHRLALRVIGNHEDARDVVQDSFVVAFTKLATLRKPATFRSWVFGIVVRTCRHVLRRRALRQRLGLLRGKPVDLDALMGDGAPADACMEVQTLFVTLGGWPVDERIAFCLQRIAGMSVEEIVDATGASRATVNRRLKRARARLGDRRV